MRSVGSRLASVAVAVAVLLAAAAAAPQEGGDCPAFYHDVRTNGRAAAEMDECSAKTGYSFLGLTRLDGSKLDAVCALDTCKSVFDRLVALSFPDCTIRGSTGTINWQKDIIAPWKSCGSRPAPGPPPGPAPNPNPTTRPRPVPPPGPGPAPDPDPEPAPAPPSGDDTPRATRPPSPTRARATPPPEAPSGDSPSNASPTPTPRNQETKAPKKTSPGGAPAPDTLDDATPSPSPTMTPASTPKPESSSRAPSSPGSSSPSPRSGSSADVLDDSSGSNASPAAGRDKRKNSSATTNQKGESSSEKKSSTGMTVGIGIGAFLFVATIVALVIRRRHKRKINADKLDQAILEDANRSATAMETHTLTVSSDPAQEALAKPKKAAAMLEKELVAYHIRAADVEDIELLGSGGHGVVYLVKYQQDRLLASKRIIPSQFTQHRLEVFVNEIKLIASLRHPNIVEFIGASWTGEADLQALFEYMPNGDLRSYLEKWERGVWNREKTQIALDVAQALAYAHSFNPPLVHRDLKARNVLLSSELRGKLSDFGVSRYYTESGTMTKGVGSTRWMAPEVMAGSSSVPTAGASMKKSYTEACDIYSFGVLLTEMDTHRVPYADVRDPRGGALKDLALMELISAGKLQPSLTASCPPRVVELAHKCLSFDPALRPNALEVSFVLRDMLKKGNGS
ncbi:hypothetical protein ATCC90586_011675 [Pythium insidiosum]|nr:hypothetical protein ATCC90586_011675 [Pythium insidiosum]